MIDDREFAENSGADDRPAEPSSNLRRDLLVGVGAFVLVVLVSIGALVALNPAGLGLLGLAGGPSGEEPIDITLVHTNDTWGYLSACGS